MTCPSTERLAEYDLGLVPSREQARIREHLALCARCAREHAALARTAELLAAVPAPAMPDDLWSGIAPRLPAQPRRRWVLWGWKPLAGAGLTMSLLAGWLLTHSPQPLPSAAPDSATYTTTHRVLAAQDPLADRASLGVVLAASQEASK
jgi:predicted anti-sigma-YlaC factor YlaD